MGSTVYKISRGLLIALLVTLMTTSYMEIGFGLTVDDFKAYIGYTVQKANDTIIVDVDNGTQDNGKNSSTDGKAYTLEQLNSNLKEYENLLEQRMVKGDNVKQIISIVKEIKHIKNEIALAEYIEKDEKAAEINKELIDNILSGLINTNTTEFDKMDIGSKFYDIGYFGDYYKKPVNNTLKLVTPYGYKKLGDGNYESKHLGIDLTAYENNEVTSMFNGVVTRVENDSTGEYSTITIYHGNGMYTLYHHIKIEENIGKGKKVTDNTLLGTVGNTTKHETHKDNHILFQVIIDGDYVNPLYVFGTTGEKMYKDWLSKSTEIYAVDKNEELFYNEKISVENINKDMKPNIRYRNSKVDDEYRIPRPGILNY